MKLCLMSFDVTTRFATWSPTRGRVGHEKIIDTKNEKFADYIVSSQQVSWPSRPRLGDHDTNYDENTKEIR